MAKATRREIRRAFGERAAVEVETIASDVRDEVRKLAEGQRIDRTLSNLHRRDHDTLRGEFHLFIGGLTWRQRLCWLVYGRTEK